MMIERIIKNGSSFLKSYFVLSDVILRLISVPLIIAKHHVGIASAHHASLIHFLWFIGKPRAPLLVCIMAACHRFVTARDVKRCHWMVIEGRELCPEVAATCKRC